MARCEISMRVVYPLGQWGNSGGMASAEARCITHGYTWPSSAMVAASDFCPFGQIEQATDVALKKITEAIQASKENIP